MKTGIERKKQTVSLMIRLHYKCKEKNHQLCSTGKDLEEYVHKRLSACKYAEQKTSCKKCMIHCYCKDMREKIREVMRFSGPRMILNHPIEAIRHLFQ